MKSDSKDSGNSSKQNLGFIPKPKIEDPSSKSPRAQTYLPFLTEKTSKAEVRQEIKTHRTYDEIKFLGANR